jgi:hypothetical protein
LYEIDYRKNTCIVRREATKEDREGVIEKVRIETQVIFCQFLLRLHLPVLKGQVSFERLSNKRKIFNSSVSGIVAVIITCLCF